MTTLRQMMTIEYKVHCDLQNITRTSVNRTFTKIKYESQWTDDIHFFKFIKCICERSEYFLGYLWKKKIIQNIPEGSCPWTPLEGTYFRNQSPFILDPHLCKTAKFESRYDLCFNCTSMDSTIYISINKSEKLEFLEMHNILEASFDLMTTFSLSGHQSYCNQTFVLKWQIVKLSCQIVNKRFLMNYVHSI